MSQIKRKRNIRKSAILSSQEDTNEDQMNSEQDRGQGELDRTFLDDLVELRRLKRKQGGINLEKLIKGDDKMPKKIKITRQSDNPFEINIDTLQVENVEQKDKRLQKMMFTQQMSAVDVDKHMMKYIEEEMSKRMGQTDRDLQADHSMNKGYDKDLFTLPESLMVASRPEKEDNVSFSAGMLSGISEVDLGVESRLKTIEETEKAKQKLLDAKKDMMQRKQNKTVFGYPRYTTLQNKNDSLDDQAKREYLKALAEEPVDGDDDNLCSDAIAARVQAREVLEQMETTQRHGSRRLLASDQQTLDRFKKRMRM